MIRQQVWLLVPASWQSVLKEKLKSPWLQFRPGYCGRENPEYPLVLARQVPKFFGALLDPFAVSRCNGTSHTPSIVTTAFEFRFQPTDFFGQQVLVFFMGHGNYRHLSGSFLDCFKSVDYLKETLIN